MLFGQCIVIFIMASVKTTETRFAVFGDSYVKREWAFCKHRLPYNVRFFGRGGMELLRIPSEDWKRLMDYKPDVVLLHLGGNDIYEAPKTKYSQAKVLFDEMVRRIRALEKAGVKVLVGQVLDRADFALRGVSPEVFGVVRKGLNRRLRDLLKHNFVFFRVHLWSRSGDLNYHYDQRDGVHLSEAGMACYEKVLKKEFGRPSYHRR